jgi:hypothetical protein
MGKCCTTTVKTQEHFTSVTVQENNMLSTLAGSTLGVWVSHGEGKFNLPEPEENYTIVSKYAYNSYPANLMVLILMRLCYVTEQVIFGDDAY